MYVTAHDLYREDPQAATDLYNQGYREGIHHVSTREADSFWRGFFYATLLALAVLALKTIL